MIKNLWHLIYHYSPLYIIWILFSMVSVHTKNNKS
ncbi:potassium-transporting ATPase [Xenorhabdus sp. Reich]|uniref:Potassium-transporting ATPase n=1 Tax=Xenorhabdus littoralis TaxID=2582835 RepID=A0ABU4SQC1_9GAMM|nr:potassium-transporting ATPase [Xenorhabdus sp. Reich]